MGDDERNQVNTADTMRERSGESSLKIKLLLRTNRFAVTGVLAAFVFAAFILFAVLLDPSLQSEIRSTDTIETIFSAMIGVVVTGTTLVVTINQLVLSQETGPLGDQRQRMSDAMDYRTYAQDLLGGVVPVDPSAFLAALVAEVERRSEVLDRIVAGDDEELERQVGEFVDSVHGNAEYAEDQLEGAQFGTFDVLFAALDYNYSWKIYEARRLRNEHEDAVTDETDDAFEGLIEVLKFFGPAREHFKTLYFEWELINLSRAMLYSAVPALVVVLGMILFVDNPGSIVGTTLGVENLVWVASAASTIALVPFMLLLSFILRIATVAKRTLSIGPFILRESARTEDIAWDE